MSEQKYHILDADALLERLNSEQRNEEGGEAGTRCAPLVSLLELEIAERRIVELEAQLAAEQREGSKAIDECDRREKQIEAIYEALGGEGEWMGRMPPEEPPNSGDLGEDAKALAERARGRIADFEMLLHKCPDCGTTTNFIGKGLYECWKCTEAEVREKLAEANAVLTRHGAQDTVGLLSKENGETRAANYLADKRIAELEAQLANYRNELTNVRPRADAYKGVCKALGIEKDIVGYVNELQAQLAELKRHDQRLQILAAQFAGRLAAESMEELAAAAGRAVDIKERIEGLEKELAEANAVALNQGVERGRAEAQAATFKAALEKCDVVMDTAAIHGVGDILPPTYRDSWAAAHTGAREALKAEEREAKCDDATKE
jgi:hypothetical protein